MTPPHGQVKVHHSEISMKISGGSFKVKADRLKIFDAKWGI